MSSTSPLKHYQEKILKLMIRQEQLLAEIYQVFAEQFPEHNDLWGSMVLEERKHAGWLQQLMDATAQQVVLFNEGRIKTYTMETFVQGVADKLSQARAGQFNLKQALACTLDLERSLIERDIFTHFTGMTEKSRNVMNFLASETKNHQAKAQEIYQKAIASEPKQTN